MGFYLNIDDSVNVPLASIRGWGDVRRYAKRLPLDDYRPFIQFVEWGKSETMEEIEDNIRTLLDKRPPKSEATKKTLTGLLAALENRPEKSIVAFVTDGMVPESE